MHVSYTSQGGILPNPLIPYHLPSLMAQCQDYLHNILSLLQSSFLPLTLHKTDSLLSDLGLHYLFPIYNHTNSWAHEDVLEF